MNDLIDALADMVDRWYAEARANGATDAQALQVCKALFLEGATKANGGPR